MSDVLTWEQLEAIRQWDTCTVANAIETFQVRLRNEGFVAGDLRCLFEQHPPLTGYAVTARIRCSGPPPVGHSYFDRTDWWNYILTVPPPRVVVLQDMDPDPGLGSFLGEVHAHILQALGCVGAVTNGAVRDVGALEPTGFQLFAGRLAVSHAYAHLVEFGGPVEIGGLTVHPGDLLHGDRHGIVSIPPQIAARVPAAAAALREKEQRVIALCHSADFSVEKLRAAVKELG